ncbi:MAG: glucose-6-phosphate isomerase [Chloroflexota bacterium]
MTLQLSLGTHQDAVDAALTEMATDNIIDRIWNIDHTVWQEDPTEVANRLGWLTSVTMMRENLDKINALVSAVKADGYTNVLLLGMGGSSLAPEVFSKTFGADSDSLQLDVLDSTDPGYVLEYDSALDPAKTLFIVATKSGGTAETLSAFKYFYNRTLDTVGADEVGKHFVAITDPGSKLVDMAQTYSFRETFENDPNIGGRYSALSFFGIVPAALVGLDLDKLFASADEAIASIKAAPADNHGALLGAAMGELAKQGRDKITLVLSPAIASFGDWVEQLIAESTGKSGTGILPVVGEPLVAPDGYKDDRFFAYIRLDGAYDAEIQALEDAGHPVARLQISDKYDMGGQFLIWEMATVIAGYRMNIQPFDQPNVESAKNAARAMIKAYEEKGELPVLEPALEADGAKVYGIHAGSPADALGAFLSNAEDGSYISIHAYIHPTAESDEALAELRTSLLTKTKLATTVGYGPRFLHSTGQLHKGDSGKGLFIQILGAMPEDADIPDEAGKTESAMTFGTLKEAQALGDRQALLENDRHFVRFYFDDVIAGIRGLAL